MTRLRHYQTGQEQTATGGALQEGGPATPLQHKKTADKGEVTFRYQNSDTKQWKTMQLPAKEFLRRYLQHVLPQGFHKVRYYGLLSPRNKVALKRLQLLLDERRKEKAAKSADTPDPPKPERRCPCCEEGRMIIISWLPKKARCPPHGRAATMAANQ